MEKPNFNNQENEGSRDQSHREVPGLDSLSERELFEKYGITPEQKEKFIKEINVYWKKVPHVQYRHGVDFNTVNFTPEWLSQGKMYSEYFTNIRSRPSDFGEYLVNPETAFLDYESLGEPEVFSSGEDQAYKDWLVEKGITTERTQSVIDYVHEIFQDTHYLPGPEYEKYLYEEYEKDPNGFKRKFPGIEEGTKYYFPGCAFAHWSGGWRALVGGIGGGGFGWFREGDNVFNGVDKKESKKVFLFRKDIKSEESGY